MGGYFDLFFPTVGNCKLRQQLIKIEAAAEQRHRQQRHQKPPQNQKWQQKGSQVNLLCQTYKLQLPLGEAGYMSVCVCEQLLLGVVLTGVNEQR